MQGWTAVAPGGSGTTKQVLRSPADAPDRRYPICNHLSHLWFPFAAVHVVLTEQQPQMTQMYADEGSAWG